MPEKVPAPSARAFLAQATKRWPRRDKASDGIVPSAAHTAANPRSDHEPGRAGYCHAVDITHDPANGCDCHDITADLARSRDKRVKYIIWDRRIWSRRFGIWKWRPYGGANPHRKHAHISIVDTKAACEDTSPWPGVAVDEAPDPPKPPAAKVYVVTASALMLREKASTNSKVKARMPHGSRVIQRGPVRDGWMRAEYRKQLGYAFARYLKEA